MICVNDEQHEKASSPIKVKEDGIETWDKDVHSQKAKSFIDFTDDGI